MTEARDNKSGALNNLYSRIAQIAVAMGGTATATTESRSFESATVATPRSEDVPALLVEMRDAFQVEFAPSRALSAHGVLSVKAKRTHSGSRKSDWDFILLQDEWRYGGKSISDDDLRKCLTAEGPRPAAY